MYEYKSYKARALMNKVKSGKLSLSTTSKVNKVVTLLEAKLHLHVTLNPYDLRILTGYEPQYLSHCRLTAYMDIYVFTQQ